MTGLPVGEGRMHVVDKGVCDAWTSRKAETGRSAVQKRAVMVALILLLAGAQGCSSIVHGTTQDLQINTVPPGAHATIGMQTCVTPCKLTVKRDVPTIQVDNGSYKKTFDLEKDFQYGAALFGNILWAEIGIIIDVATGAAWEIKPVNLELDAAEEGLPRTTGRD